MDWRFFFLSLVLVGLIGLFGVLVFPFLIVLFYGFAVVKNGRINTTDKR